MPFTFTLAWRDSRRMRRRLLLYVSAMALGVAALVAIRSFGVNLQRALGEQAREVFGADLRLYTDGEFSEDTEAFLDSLTEATGAERAREVTLASMALFPESGGTRLAQVRALRGDYPFYGGLETLPAEATEMWQRKGAALVDAALLLQYGAEVGDTVRIGARAYPVAGQIEGITGQTDVGALVGPRVYIPLDDLDPGLLGFGSRSSFTEAFRLEDVNPDTLLNRLRPELDRLGLRGETVSGAQGDWAEGLSGLTRFLELVGFIALLLGGLGVASAIHVYVRQKAEAVATLRCLGATAGQTLRVFTLQAAALGLLAALLGAVLGVGIQALLPRVLGPFLPVEVAVTFVWEPVLVGVGVGLAVALAFALFPLLSVRRIPPLRALRADAEAEGRDPLRGLLALALAAGVGVFAWAQTGEWEAGVGFPLAVLVALAVLALTARLLQALVRRAVPRAWPYTWRQGLANLHRPGNQTLVLLLTLGLGTFLLLTLTLIEQALLAPIAQSEATTQADVVLFDIQPDQRDSVRALVEAQGLPVVDEVPIVPMQLDAINGRSVTELVADSTDRRPRWALEREYRSTFRDHPIPTEEVIAGEFVPRVAPDASPIPVSVEADLARDLQLRLGSRLTWNVAGRTFETTVASLRRVDWARVSPNFFVVFPAGPLDEAPQFGVLTTRAGTPEASARLQRAAVEAFPNVSAVDVRLVRGLIEGVLDRVAFVLRFMALFCLATGLVVLAGSVRLTRLQRMTESVLLRTLGASRAQVARILVAEYLLLGLLAALTGLLLAVAGAWTLARFVFEVPFVLAWPWAVGALVAVPALTILFGALGSRGFLRRPPLDVLRAEG